MRVLSNSGHRGHAVRPGQRGRTALTAVAAFTALGLLPAPAVAAEEAGERRRPPAAVVAVRHAVSQVGKPYRYGGTGPEAFDCSGLVQWAYGKVGVRTGRTTYDQFRHGKVVPRSKLRRGDLLFFYSGPSHVGLYVGRDQKGRERMVHAGRTGNRVQVVDMADYFDRHFVGARRIIGRNRPVAEPQG
ncbi:C40 family peptidase [Marinactinospora rubrisoli]|uniref:C40 family peptidase n=1 Tax=Marinactinospora rubrisoli TaxID=2715399 RepID=A0ABW2K8N7_9ACTN